MASRARSRSARGGIRWDRVGRTALIVVLGVVVLLYVQPVMAWFQQSGTADRQRAEVESLEAERSELEERRSSLRGPEAVEREARRLGMVREGERAYAIEE